MGRGKLPVDWGMGRALAYRLAAGLRAIGVRISGEDVGRGTFSHRHCRVHDQKRDQLGRRAPIVPLQNVCRETSAVPASSTPSSPKKPCWPSNTATPPPTPIRAGDLGSAVRRLRQRRAGGHRPVHRLRRVEMGPRLRPGSCCCRTATKARARSTPRRVSERFMQLCAETNIAALPARPRPRRSSTCCVVRCRPQPAQAADRLSRRSRCCATRTPLHRSTNSPRASFQPVIGEVDASRKHSQGQTRHPLLRQGLLRPGRRPSRRKHHATSPSSVWSSSTPSRTRPSRPNWKSTRRPPKSSGARTSRATRAPGTSSPATTPTRTSLHSSRNCGYAGRAGLRPRPRVGYPTCTTSSKRP